LGPGRRGEFDPERREAKAQENLEALSRHVQSVPRTTNTIDGVVQHVKFESGEQFEFSLVGETKPPEHEDLSLGGYW